MKTLILYDSVYGNTEKIALAISNALGSQEDVSITKVSDAKPDQFAGLNLLIVGAPTQRFRTTAAMNDLLKMIPQNSLKGAKVAAFDTRLTVNEINKTPILAFFVKMFGVNAYAARLIANRLRKKGGEFVGSPEGFFVEGMKGPLVEGELERAVNWARQIIAKSK
jgi:flavodoxin